MSASEFRNLLEAGDVPGLMAYWGRQAEHMPQPKSMEQARITMHMARTAAESVRFIFRAWSHRWLVERDLPSQLPDRLRPSAEQICPKVASAVGISVNTHSKYLEPAMLEVRGSMEAAVLEADADGLVEDAAHVTLRMREAKEKTLKALFGR